jgi:cyclophilin family peptidyl-prolyl cis-trans isomerase
MGRAGSPSPAVGIADPSPGPTYGVRVPTMSEVDRLTRTTITFRLSGGRSLSIKLYAEQAPTAAARLVGQVKSGEWNGLTFHRVEPGFVVQGGSPSANEYAGAAAFARDEFSALSNLRGTVGISTRGADTGDGQIFINLVDNARLDFAYTIVGMVTGDLSVIDDLLEGEEIVEAFVREDEVAR